MPIYDYFCDHCGFLEEFRRPVDLRDAPLECNECKREMVRVFDPDAVQIKMDFLKECGFFYCTRSDFEPDEKRRPDLFQPEDKVFAMSGAKRNGAPERNLRAAAKSAEKK